MKKSEFFALITGFVGLTVDLAAIVHFFFLSPIGTPAKELNTSSRFEVLTILVLIYSWFIISWMLIRRHWVKTQIGKEVRISLYTPSPQTVFFNRTRYTVAALGVIAFSLSLPLTFNYRPAQLSWYIWCIAILGANVLGLIFVGFLIDVVIVNLMPIIYTDMENLAE
jgi:hypothetical protein